MSARILHQISFFHEPTPGYVEEGWLALADNGVVYLKLSAINDHPATGADTRWGKVSAIGKDNLTWEALREEVLLLGLKTEES